MRCGGYLSFLATLAVLCLCTLTYIEGTRYLEESNAYKNDEELRQRLLQSSRQLGATLALLNNSYEESVYGDPDTSGIMQQQFRVTEHLYQLLQVIALQNQTLLAAQGHDPAVIDEAWNEFQSFGEVLNEEVTEP